PNKPERVRISSSTGPDDEFIQLHDAEYQQIVHPRDPQSFIRLVQDHASERIVRRMAGFHTSLFELDLAVSTGRVVDFRVRDFLRSDYEDGAVPLLFPTHMSYGLIKWPWSGNKKPNALLDTEQTKTLQIPNDYYVLVKRFTSKEEKKRIV